MSGNIKFIVINDDRADMSEPPEYNNDVSGFLLEMSPGSGDNIIFDNYGSYTGGIGGIPADIVNTTGSDTTSFM